MICLTECSIWDLSLRPYYNQLCSEYNDSYVSSIATFATTSSPLSRNPCHHPFLLGVPIFLNTSGQLSNMPHRSTQSFVQIPSESYSHLPTTSTTSIFGTKYGTTSSRCIVLCS